MRTIQVQVCDYDERCDSWIDGLACPCTELESAAGAILDRHEQEQSEATSNNP